MPRPGRDGRAKRSRPSMPPSLGRRRCSAISISFGFSRSSRPHLCPWRFFCGAPKADTQRPTDVLMITPRHCSAALLVVISLGGGGCTMGPNYAEPKAVVAAAFTNPTSPDSAVSSKIDVGIDAPTRWWQTFHDPKLDDLVRRAMGGNRDLKLAASRVRQARLQRAVALGGLWPEIDATGGYNRGHGSQNVVLPFGNTSSTSTPSPSSSRSPSIQADAAPADASSPAIPTAGGGSSSRPAGPTNPIGEGGLPGG